MTTPDTPDRAGTAQELLARSVLDKLNDALDGGAGTQPIERAAAQDHSPEATAGRIVSQSLSLFEDYAARTPDESVSAVAERFVALVRGSVVRNIGDTRALLEGLGALQGEIATNIDRTEELVVAGFDEFLANAKNGDVSVQS